MLSGIGPSQQLQSVGIPPILDLPDVGANLQDQSILTLQWAVNGTTLSRFFSDPAAFGAALAQYAVNKTGIAAGNTVVNTIGFLRWPNNSPALKARDPAAGPNSPHFQFSFLVRSSPLSPRMNNQCGNACAQETFYPNVGQVAPTTGNWLSVSVVVQSPTSRAFPPISTPSVRLTQHIHRRLSKHNQPLTLRAPHH
jgi:choline dehydrogenase-like flavoprotein